MATSGENYWPPTGRTSWPLTDTLLMHYVSGLDFSDPAGIRAQLPRGSRVRAVWTEERSGQILDIAYFEPAT